MNCPHCGKEMIKGKMLSRQVLKFVPDNTVKDGWLDRSIWDDYKEISSKDTTFWNHTVGISFPKYTAYHCPDCQKFIFDGELI